MSDLNIIHMSETCDSQNYLAINRRRKPMPAAAPSLEGKSAMMNENWAMGIMGSHTLMITAAYRHADCMARLTAYPPKSPEL
eukprot:1348576-Amorphochlora_amoeboformis.AAC.1